MDRVEIWFFLVGLVITILPALVFYLILYNRPKSPFDKQRVQKIDDFELHYVDVGRGPTLFLIHGIGASLHCWNELIPMLAEKYRVIAVDLPGFGLSGRPESGGYGLDEQVLRLEKFLDRLKVEKAALVGNSMGGNLALWMAKRNPTRFPSVVAIAPATNRRLVPWILPHLGPLSGLAARMFLRPIAVHFHETSRGLPERLTDDYVDLTLSVYRRNPAAIRALIDATAAIRDPRLETETFSGRTLVLWGEQDKLVPRWSIDELMPRLRSARLAVHPRAGHQPQHDVPEWVHQQIETFLS